MPTTIQPPQQSERRSPNRRGPTPAPASLPAGPGYLGPATILEINPRDGLVLVEWKTAGQSCLSWARPATATPTQFKPRDTALVLSQNLEDFYLIGLLQSTNPAIQPATPASEVVQVHSPRGELVLEYHPDSGKTRVNVPQGDLEFITKNGNISFQSARKISFTACRLETLADTVVSKAKNVYRTVEELTQLQTGRLRTLVKGSWLAKSKNAFLKADEDFKVDGEQIHLG
jgi:hypothetical protein